MSLNGRKLEKKDVSDWDRQSDKQSEVGGSDLASLPS